MHVKKGDRVMVISGKDKGKTGVILTAYPKKDRVLVEGVNIIKKHIKPNQANPQGGIVSQEAAIHVSNVMLIDPKTGEPTRVGYKVEDGKKVKKKKNQPQKKHKKKKIVELYPFAS